METVINHVIDYFNHPWGYVELAGSIFSLICVWQALTRNIWTWFWGTLGVLCFGPLFWNYQLYSDAWLQILFYLPMQVIGFWWWKTKGPTANDDLPINSLRLSRLFDYIGTVILLSVFNGWAMQQYTDASFPYFDALTTWMSIAAQMLMINKYRESWYFWIGMDIIAIWIYYQKALYITSGLYVIFLILATLGMVAWHRAYKEQKI